MTPVSMHIKSALFMSILYWGIRTRHGAYTIELLLMPISSKSHPHWATKQSQLSYNTVRTSMSYDPYLLDYLSFSFPSEVHKSALSTTMVFFSLDIRIILFLQKCIKIEASGYSFSVIKDKKIFIFFGKIIMKNLL